MTDLNRPPYPGPFGGEFTMPPFDPLREEVESMRRPMEIAAPELTLTDAEEAALRIGMGRIDMEIRWLASLDDDDELRLWRSWSGHEIYRATFERHAERLTPTKLLVESDPEIYDAGPEGDATEDFMGTLRHCLSLIMPTS